MYVTDSLRIMGENTAKYAGGSYIRERWVDIVSPKKKDTRTGEEIVSDVIKKAGLKVVSKDGFVWSIREDFSGH